MVIHVNPADLSNGAVATPEEALKILRKAPGEKKMIIHSGVYYATKLCLTKEDSGLVIEGDGQGRAILSGGVPVGDWTLDEKTGWLYTDVPKVDGEYIDFRLLLSHKGDYLKKARYPLVGELEHLSVFDSMGWKGSCFGGWGRELNRDELDNFVYKPEDFSDDFVFENAEVQVFHSWNESYTKVVGMDKETNTFYLDPPCGHPVGSFWKHQYVIYNTAEGMAEDGRWYHEKTEHKIYYRPFPNEKAEDFSAIVPLTTRVIYFEDGTNNITIRDIDITAATTPVVTDIYSTKVMRGAGGFVSKEQSGAIEGEGVSDIILEDLHIYKTGGHAIKLRGDDIYVRGAHITECGAGGVTVLIDENIPYGASDEVYSKWSVVENCRIDHIGLDYYSAVAIFIDSAVVRGNYIEYTPYSGIVAYGDNVLIENNVVLDPMQTLNDGAAIYKLLDNRGIIRNNYVHRRCGNQNINCKGLYLDAPGVDFKMIGNVVKGFKSAFHYHIAQPGTVWADNYFEYDGDLMVTFHRSKGAHVINNVFRSTGLIRIQAPEGAIAEFRGNVLRYGGEMVAYEEGNGGSQAKPARPFDIEGNIVERIEL